MAESRKRTSQVAGGAVVNTNHGIRKRYRWRELSKVKQPRKQRDYNENMQVEILRQYKAGLNYYDKLMKYWKRSGG